MTLAQWEDAGGLDEPGRDDEGRLTKIIQVQRDTDALDKERLLTGAEPARSLEKWKERCRRTEAESQEGKVLKGGGGRSERERKTRVRR